MSESARIFAARGAGFVDDDALQHRQGRLEEAALLYRKMLAENPRNADALHLLGVIELQKRSLPAALRFIDRAIEIDPDNAAFLSNRGVALQDSRPSRSNIDLASSPSIFRTMSPGFRPVTGAARTTTSFPSIKSHRTAG